MWEFFVCNMAIKELGPYITIIFLREWFGVHPYETKIGAQNMRKKVTYMISHLEALRKKLHQHLRSLRKHTD